MPIHAFVPGRKVCYLSTIPGEVSRKKISKNQSEVIIADLSIH